MIEKRPWGSFKVLEKKPDYWVKELVIDEGMRFSKQLHANRSELWHISAGSVLINLNEKRFRAEAGDTVFIPKKAVHRVKNVGKSKARIIEFAFGEVDEGDIVRIEDDFGRAKG